MSVHEIIVATEIALKPSSMWTDNQRDYLLGLLLETKFFKSYFEKNSYFRIFKESLAKRIAVVKIPANNIISGVGKNDQFFHYLIKGNVRRYVLKNEQDIAEEITKQKLEAELPKKQAPKPRVDMSPNKSEKTININPIFPNTELGERSSRKEAVNSHRSKSPLTKRILDKQDKSKSPLPTEPKSTDRLNSARYRNKSPGISVFSSNVSRLEAKSPNDESRLIHEPLSIVKLDQELFSNLAEINNISRSHFFQDEIFKYKHDKDFKPGETIGEKHLSKNISKTPRHFYVYVNTEEVWMIRLSKQDFNDCEHKALMEVQEKSLAIKNIFPEVRPDYESVVKFFEIKMFKKDELIFEEHSAVDSIYFVLEGKVNSFKEIYDPDMINFTKKLIGEIINGHVVGEEILKNVKYRQNTCIAGVKGAKCLKVLADDFKEFRENHLFKEANVLKDLIMQNLWLRFREKHLEEKRWVDMEFRILPLDRKNDPFNETMGNGLDDHTLTKSKNITHNYSRNVSPSPNSPQKLPINLNHHHHHQHSASPNKKLRSILRFSRFIDQKDSSLSPNKSNKDGVINNNNNMTNFYSQTHRSQSVSKIIRIRDEKEKTIINASFYEQKDKSIQGSKPISINRNSSAYVRKRDVENIREKI